MARELPIGTRLISDDEPAWVVAELGGNHGGDINVALELIATAARCGADAIKLQKRHNPTLYTTALLDAPYENENSFGPTYGAHREAIELTPIEMFQCFNAARLHGMEGFATAFDEHSVQTLMEIGGVPAFKIHSGGLTDERLIHSVAECGLPVLLSTGGGTMEDIDRAVGWLGACPHAILHCTASYPLRSEDANLRCILTLRNRYPETVIGFSSHSPGIAFSLIAYAFGARIIEHHVTLSRASKGTDHAFSLEPKGLQSLVEDLGKLRFALGDGVKRFLPCEMKPVAKMRRHATAEGWKIDGTL